MAHDRIFEALQKKGLHQNTIQIIENLYSDCTTKIRSEEGYTDPISLESGVRQGCSLSPIIFKLTIESILEATNLELFGFNLSGNKIAALAYADDIVLVSSSTEGLTRLLNAVSIAAANLDLNFNPSKCVSLHIDGNKNKTQPTKFKVQGNEINTMQEDDLYAHLGFPTGYGSHRYPVETIAAMDDEMDLYYFLLACPLAKT